MITKMTIPFWGDTVEQQTFFDLYTLEGEHLPQQLWQSYPRPQMQRDSFFNLNGEWEFAVCSDSNAPAQYCETIRVPFAPQTLLSGIHRECPEESFLFYRKSFRLPDAFETGRVLLHIGAADQIAAVWLNDVFLGEHVGGYDAFSFDVTTALQEENTLLIRVTDQMSRRVLPYGKQCAKRGGMWYTPISGIWQTVWMERVPEQYIHSLRIRTTENGAEISVAGDITEGLISVQTPAGTREFSIKNGFSSIQLDDPKLWSPEDPYLYRCTIQAGEDLIRSYFALRTLSIREVDGIQRLCLNGKPYFFHGLLDQGYWSDGLLTPADPSCYEKDILAMKSLGFNTLRKHIKVEPEQFYYDCDRLGMIVFQDMVNNGDYNFIRDTALPTIGLKRLNDRHLHRDKATREAFLCAMETTVRQLANHPCICYWTIFNEGWGQFESTRAYHRLKNLDSSRFIASVSGWFKGGESDVSTEHVYFKPFRPSKTGKPLVLSEFGGYALMLRDHAFHPGKEYGYRHYKNREEFVRGIQTLYEKEIIPAVKEGLCGAIYTQVSDVEDETNGLFTFDRKVLKLKPEEMLPIAQKLKEVLESSTSAPEP